MPPDRRARRDAGAVDDLTPREIVAELDRYIVGQDDGQAGGRDRAAQPHGAGSSSRRRLRDEVAARRTSS